MEISTGEIAVLVAIALIAVNMGSVLAIWWDKRRATRGQWRIREETLLVWALVGGWIGGAWAMRKFRHKTSKPSFTVRYAFAAVLNTGAIAAIAYAVLA